MCISKNEKVNIRQNLENLCIKGLTEQKGLLPDEI